MPRASKKKKAAAAPPAEPTPPASAPVPAPVQGVDPRRASKLDVLIGACLGLAAFLGLFLTEKSVGVPRDESFYFDAANAYAGWFKLLLARPAQAFTDAATSRYFEYNHEHPALMKELFGLSHWLFFENLHWVREIASYRLPVFVLAGLFALCLYLFGAGLRGRGAGVFAVLAFFLCPRDWFHAHLACFDFPVCATWLFVVYAYWRAETSRRWVVLCGILFGLALATKHNAFFLPVVLAGHWIVARGWYVFRQRGFAGFVKAIPNSFWSMAALGPVVFYLHWPYIWHHPVDRVGFWIAFHLHHVNYAWYYLGDLMREPPFPVFYAWVVTALTVPIALIAAMATGLLSTLWVAVRDAVATFRAKAEPTSAQSDTWLLLINCIAPIAILMPPEVPRFGGSKHWMAAMPFLCILAGVVVVRMARLIAERFNDSRALDPALAALFVLVLAPGAWGLVHIGGYGTSYYNELAGGQPGAAALGMQRQFWSNNVTGVFGWLNENAPQRARVFFHEVTGDSFRAYQANGMLRRDIQFSGLEQADIACYQYHQEFRFWEYAIWTNMHTRWPAYGLYLDEVPNIECYQRDRAF